MPVVTSHAPGTPSWSELSTTDEAGALSFYSALFGWEDEANEMGPNWYYHMQKVQDQYACAIYQQGEEERSQNVPPHWNIYFTVENVDNTMATITRNGGNVVFGPHDVFEAGRMAMCQDPQDAFFAIWQPKMHIGAGIKGEAGATCWHELLTTDQNAALDFYVATLGVERGPFMESSQYAILNAGGTEVAGVMQMTPGNGCIPTPLGRLLRRGERG